MDSSSEVEVRDVEYIIHVEYSSETIVYQTRSEKFIGTACDEIYRIFQEKHIPLTAPPHELFYNPDLRQNVEIKQKRASSNLGANRGSEHILSPRQKETSLVQVATQNATKTSKSAHGSWRALASILQTEEIEIKKEIPVEGEAEDEEDIDFERLSGFDRRTARSSSFDLGGMMDRLPATTLVLLQRDKRLLSYNLPCGSHLLFKSTKDTTNEERPIFTGEKCFIRVHDATGSYKTLFQPEDTPAKYLYSELTEKFNLTNTQDYRIFLLKNGVETMLGDNSTPIKLLADMEEGELENVTFYFKDAGRDKTQSASQGPQGPLSECILPLLESVEEQGQLDLSFYRVEEFPALFYDLDITNFTYNQSHLTTLPSLSHFTSLTELRVVNNHFKEIPECIFEVPSLTELDFGNNLLTSISNNISKLTRLEEIYFYVNQIREIPEGISALKDLRVLNLSNNFIKEIPGPIVSHFRMLQQLKFTKNELTTIPNEITELVSLVDISVAQNQLTKLPNGLSKLTNLRWVNFKNNQFDEFPKELSSLDRLEEVIASHNKIKVFDVALLSVKMLALDHNEIEVLGDTVQLDSVVMFTISNNKLHTITEECLKSMKQLTKLSLAFNELTGLPEAIGRLNYLTQLDCKHNHIHKLPEVSKMTLKVLDCGSNQLVSLPSPLWRIPSLWFLQASNNPLSLLPPSSPLNVSDVFLGISQLTLDQISICGQMKNLRTLDLGHANLKSIPSSICKLKNLVVLIVCGNRLKSLPKDIGKITKLRELYASCNNLTSLPSSMKIMKYLNVIDVSCNNLKSVSELGSIPSLQWIDLSYNKELRSIPSFVEHMHKFKAFHVFGCSLKKPIHPELLHLSHFNMTPSNRFLVSVADLRGRRDTMEDSMIIRGSFAGNPEWDFYCVLDGHGGRRVAEFGGMELASRLEQLLIQSKCTNPEETIQIAFQKVQAAVKSTHVGIMEGCTAVMALFLGNVLYVANVGDSRAVLARGNEALRLSYDHKPDLPEEEERICLAGGFVADGRINSVLACSRVFGDFALEQWISSEPFIRRIEIQSTDKFLILACDGVWDVIEDQHAVEVVSRADPIRSASLLRDSAYMMGSMDNISCCIVHLTK